MKMKNVKQFALAFVVIIATGLTSCRKDTMQEPSVKPATGDLTETQVNGLVAATKYRLTKQGNTTLHYLPNGKLGKVVYSPTNYIEYAWGYNGVVATNYIDNKKYSTNTITTNSSGKCTYAVFKKYKGDLVDAQWSWKFEYTNDQLTKQVNPYDPDERYEYTYKTNNNNVGNNLEKISYYGTQGDLRYVTEYSSSHEGWSNPIIDKYPINPEYSELEQYLQLYGKFNNYLVKTITRKYIYTNSTDTEYIFYYLNSEGYVNSRKWMKTGAGTVTAYYTYQQIR